MLWYKAGPGCGAAAAAEGGGGGQYISSGRGFLDFIKTYRDGGGGAVKGSRSLFPVTPFFFSPYKL